MPNEFNRLTARKFATEFLDLISIKYQRASLALIADEVFAVLISAAIAQVKRSHERELLELLKGLFAHRIENVGNPSKVFDAVLEDNPELADILRKMEDDDG